MLKRTVVSPIAAVAVALTSAVAQPVGASQAGDLEPRVLSVAEASSSDPFSALVGERSAKRKSRTTRIQVERYIIATDERAFLFENSGPEARLKFLCRDEDKRLDCKIDPERTAEEIFLLKTVTGPRGDLIFKDNGGETFLRIASYGGATVFWPGEKAGQAASKSFGEETSLRLPFADVATAKRRAQMATAHISAKAGAPIMIDLGEPAIDDASGAAVLADAVVRAASGVHQVAGDATGADVIAKRIEKIQLIPAEVPELSLDGKVLEVRYNPSGDLAGRPSSAAVARFLEETL